MLKSQIYIHSKMAIHCCWVLTLLAQIWKEPLFHFILQSHVSPHPESIGPYLKSVVPNVSLVWAEGSFVYFSQWLIRIRRKEPGQHRAVSCPPPRGQDATWEVLRQQVFRINFNRRVPTPSSWEEAMSSLPCPKSHKVRPFSFPLSPSTILPSSFFFFFFLQTGLNTLSPTLSPPLKPSATFPSLPFFIVLVQKPMSPFHVIFLPLTADWLGERKLTNMRKKIFKNLKIAEWWQ